LVGKIGEFEESGVKLQCSTEERERLLVRVIERFEKLRVREIGIPHYYELSQFLHNENTKVTPLMNQTWLALFFERFVDKWKVHHNWTSRIVGVRKHVILPSIAILKELIGSVNGREFEVVLPCPFLCQQKFLEITIKNSICT